MNMNPIPRTVRQPCTTGQWRVLALCGLLLSAGPLTTAHAHPVGPSGLQELAWQNPQISRIFAAYWPGHDVVVNGHQCVTGRVLFFDVRDEFAHDIDEDVEVTLELARVGESGPELRVDYERNDEGPAAKQIPLPKVSGDGSCTVHFTLERARFAADGKHVPDLTLTATNGPAVTVRDITFKRSHTTPVPQAYGRLALEVLDEHNAKAPALVGLYDERNRMPRPSLQAVPLRLDTDDISRVIATGQRFRGAAGFGASLPWPSANQTAFYINGRYEARVPAGRYDLVVSKGPEYRMFRRSVEVKPEAIVSVDVRLVRWDNLSEKGWYSGDDHIHYTRASALDDESLLLLTQAEDLHVANILQMGNVANAHYRPYDWKVVTSAQNSTFVLAPGQEDPRTGYRGHTIQLHLPGPVRDPDHYLLYDLVFRRAREQGGVTGYAHVGWPYPALLSSPQGLALDVPEGLVDFVEVLQAGNANLQVWFDFLNLGYKLAPAAGTDYPALDQRPGAVRSYVKVDGTFMPQAWFDGLKEGRTFVTNGPMLEFTINGQAMGSELRLKAGEPLVISARARINPDINLLDSVELIEQGQVIHTVGSKDGAPELRLDYQTTAAHGTWFVVRANGKPRGKDDHTVAVSASIYVLVDGQSFWKPSEIPQIVGRLKQALELLSKYEPSNDEAYETLDRFKQVWQAEQPAIQQRVQRALAVYDDLVAKAAAAK
ncbi:MAG: CehA/McbA family metallohydrolase [Opitutaceae bacterium]|nr:CehA/McbA family metallohydrolase [Opitutaceae bacterium]